MGLLEDLQAKADLNGDGNIAPEDFTSLGEQYGLDSQKIEDLKSKIDPNGDGSLDINELKDSLAGFDLSSVTEGGFGGIIEQIKNRFFG